MDLGITIRNLRKRNGLTQGQFATACGITQTYLSQIENNLREPNLSTLKVIGRELKVPLPIIFFMSMTEDDVQANKRRAFQMISPAVKSMVDEFFAV